MFNLILRYIQSMWCSFYYINETHQQFNETNIFTQSRLVNPRTCVNVEIGQINELCGLLIRPPIMLYVLCFIIHKFPFCPAVISTRRRSAGLSSTLKFLHIESLKYIS